MVIEHEMMHQETLLYMMQRLPLPQKVKPAWLPPYVLTRGRPGGKIEIPAGTTTLGGFVSTDNVAAANIGRMSAEIEGLARDLRGEFSNMSGEHGEKVAGLLTKATEAAAQISAMSREFEGLAKELRTSTPGLGEKAGSAFTQMQTAMRDFAQTARDLSSVADELDQTVAENRELFTEMAQQLGELHSRLHELDSRA